MAKSLALVSEHTQIELRDSILGENWRNRSHLTLSLTIKPSDLHLRDLSEFLLFIDRIYGRMTTDSLWSYARHEHAQLHIQQIRAGSWDVILQGMLAQVGTPFIIIFSVVSCICSIALVGGKAYQSYESGRYTREKRLALQDRRKIGEFVKLHERLGRLPQNTQQRLMQQMQLLLAHEERLLSRTQRFAQRSVTNVRIHSE